MKEFGSPRSGKLLECPASGKGWLVHVAVEVHITHPRIVVPSIHRIDRLQEFRATSPVNTTRIDPQLPVTVLLGLLTTLDNILVTVTLPTIIPFSWLHRGEPSHPIVSGLSSPAYGMTRIVVIELFQILDFGTDYSDIPFPVKNSYYIQKPHLPRSRTKRLAPSAMNQHL